MSRLPERIYDVSLPLRAGGLVYPGDPEIRVEAHSSIAAGYAANVSALELGSHAGTHVDAPRHFLADGETVDRIPLERLVGPAVVLELAGDGPAIGAAELGDQDLRGERRVLLKTRNSGLLRKPEFTAEYRALSLEGAEYLVARGVELVGIDYLSVERYGSKRHPVHHLLLERGVVIVEGLDLAEVPAGVCRFICLPLRLVGLDGAPARAVVIR
jgi:arylformamidase